MTFPAALWLTSDAARTGAAGAVCVALAVLAGAADRRRQRRTRIDAVGWMPWTTVSFVALFGALVLLALTIKALAGL